MKICILGSTGVIGNFLNKALFEKYEVQAPTRKDLDIRNQTEVKRFFEKQKFDVVINAAINPDSNMHASQTVASDNLVMFSNLYSCRNSFDKYINFCSGAAFDRTKDISSAREEDIFQSTPIDAYGLSKNICSRICKYTPNYFTIRIFGIFHKNELQTRLIPRIVSGQKLILNDRYFDYFYQEDLLPVLDHYMNGAPVEKDVNLVYREKMLLSEFAKLVCESSGIDFDSIQIVKNNSLNYTGEGEKLNDIGFSFIGIEDGIKRYFS